MGSEGITKNIGLKGFNTPTSARKLNCGRKEEKARNLKIPPELVLLGCNTLSSTLNGN